MKNNNKNDDGSDQTATYIANNYNNNYTKQYNDDDNDFHSASTADIPSLFPKHSASGHLVVNYLQAYVHGPPFSQLLLTSKTHYLSHELHLSMSSNRLSLNSKTQLLWFGSTLKLDIPFLTLQFPHFTFLSSVRDIGPWFLLFPSQTS